MYSPYIVTGVLSFVLLAVVVNTPSVMTWIISLFKRSQPTTETNGQCVRVQYPLSFRDVDGKLVNRVIGPETAGRLLEDLQVQLERGAK